MMRRRICIIGAGIIGLSSAVRIQDEIPDIDVTVIADTFSPHTTSDGSAGFWEPHLVNPSQSDDIRKWGQETFDHLMKLVKSEDAGTLGAQQISGYNFNNDLIKEDPYWKNQVFGYRKLDIQEMKMHPSQKEGVFFTTVMTDVKSYLPWLMQKFRSKGGMVRFKTISSLSQIADEFDVIVNCVGLGARELLKDQEMNPIRGQVMRVYAPWIKHFFIEHNDETRKATYIIPGRDWVTLGGTGQQGNWNTNVDLRDRSKIWDECTRLVPSLKGARKVADWVGLRPGRSVVRLELEEVKGITHPIQVVHNYGHSGSGVTLHWGCAGDAVKLVQKALTKLPLSSKL